MRDFKFRFFCLSENSGQRKNKCDRQYNCPHNVSAGYLLMVCKITATVPGLAQWVIFVPFARPGMIIKKRFFKLIVKTKETGPADS